MSYNRSLNYLKGRVNEEIGVLDQFVSDGFVEAALNEGQRRAAPRLLYTKVAWFTINEGSFDADLPADLYELTRFIPNENTRDVAPYIRHGSKIVFHCQTTDIFDGRLLYRAYFPAITNTQQCLLPEGALDALIAYAHCKVLRKVANDRSNYKQFSTITGGSVTRQDLEASALEYLREYDAAIEDATVLPAPVGYYG